MRRFLFLATIIVLMLFVFLSGTGILLASAGPFQPGDIFFPLQHYAEQTRARSTHSQTAQALYLLTLAERRTGDLLDLSASRHEVVALEFLDLAIDQVATAISAIPPPDAIVLARRLADLTADIEAALSSLNRVQHEDNALYTAFQAKVIILRNLVELTGTAQSSPAETDQSLIMLPFLSKSASNSAAQPDPTIDPRAVVFLPGSAGAQHAFFPLTGRHADLECTACHINGRYAGTPTQCEDCHALDGPASHFAGACAACHNPVSWSSVTFDHNAAGAKDCLACHENDKPANHFSGQCSACHNTANWSSATFNHQAVNATDCQACHSPDKPKNHFSGQCSQCHNTSSWGNATFNHQAAGATDCQACHIDDQPANHPSGQCSQCHNTSNWSDATFDHQAAAATDCQACHSSDKPENHFSGQCSQCHNTANWGDATFDHQAAGATDCQACHASDRPANHPSGQCSQCHNTSSWSDATFDHQAAGATDCQGCHANDRPANHPSGQCSQCHGTSNWGDATFDHQAAGTTDCQACHANDRPDNHFSGQCSQCHNTNSWGDADFNHSFPMNHGDANGDCAKCHPSGGSEWTCYTCHDQGKMEDKHSEEGISNISTKCLDCHPGGKEHD